MYKLDTVIKYALTMNIVFARVSLSILTSTMDLNTNLSILTSTMDSFKKDTHRYAFAMVKAARSMPSDIAEKLDYIKELRFNVQLKVLRKRMRRVT